jgi:hypothetical protein
MKYFLAALIFVYHAFSFPNFFTPKKGHKNSIQIQVMKNPVKMYWLKLEKGGYMIVGNPPEEGCREISDYPVNKLKNEVIKNIKTGKKTLFVKSLNAEIYLGKEPVYDDTKRFHIYGFNPTTGISLKEYNQILEIKKIDEEQFKNLMKSWLPEEELPDKLWLICKKREFSQKETRYIVKIYPISLKIAEPDLKIENINLKNGYLQIKVFVFPFFPLINKKISSLNLNPFQRDINIAFDLKLKNPPNPKDNIFIIPIPEKINGEKISYLYSWWGSKEKFAVGSERILKNPINIEFKICKVKLKNYKKEIDVLNDDFQVLKCGVKSKIKFEGTVKFIVDANFNDNIPDIWTEDEPDWTGTPVNRKPKEFIKKFQVR